MKTALSATAGLGFVAAAVVTFAGFLLEGFCSLEADNRNFVMRRSV
jgi:hypothetical protein